jgi:hypothetical protein
LLNIDDKALNENIKLFLNQHRFEPLPMVKRNKKRCLLFIYILFFIHAQATGAIMSQLIDGAELLIAIVDHGPLQYNDKQLQL